MTEPWWKSATCDEVYPRPFADSTGDCEGILSCRRDLDDEFVVLANAQADVAATTGAGV